MLLKKLDNYSWQTFSRLQKLSTWLWLAVREISWKFADVLNGWSHIWHHSARSIGILNSHLTNYWIPILCFWNYVCLESDLLKQTIQLNEKTRQDVLSFLWQQHWLTWKSKHEHFDVLRRRLRRKQFAASLQTLELAKVANDTGCAWVQQQRQKL